MFNRLLTTGCLFAWSILVSAQSADSTKSVPAPTPLNISGEVDVYYRYSGNGIARSAGDYSTAYTTDHNSFSLGILNLQFSKEVGKIGFMADVMIGPRADFTNAVYAGQTLSFFKQLYVTYKPTDKFKITAGNFSTFVGYELIEANNNLNYSMSYGFSYSPFTHTGIKGEYAFNDHWTLMGAVMNRNDTKWDSGKKYLAGQIAYTEGKVKCLLAYLNGNDGDTLHTGQTDLVVSYQATPKLALATNISTKLYTPKEGVSAPWTTFILFANYKVKDNFILAARGEYFMDPKNVYFTSIRDTDVRVSGVTFSANWKVADLTIIPEVRFDSATKNIFKNDKGAFVANETSFLLAAVYKF
jgi:hypothetical protein